MKNSIKLSLLSLLCISIIFNNLTKAIDIVDQEFVQGWKPSDTFPLSDEEYNEIYSKAYNKELKRIDFVIEKNRQRLLDQGLVSVTDFWGNETWHDKKELEKKRDNQFKPYIDLSFLNEDKDLTCHPKNIRKTYPVVWFMDQFFSKNPITSMTLGAGTIASIFGYFYYRYQIQQAKEIEKNDLSNEQIKKE